MITRGSNTDFNSKRQHRDYYREVNHVAVEGPLTQTKWSHIPIFFSTQDVNQTSFPHTDAMVLTIHIDTWDVSKILVDNGHQAEILFLSTFEKMGYDKKHLKEPTKMSTKPHSLTLMRWCSPSTSIGGTCQKSLSTMAAKQKYFFYPPSKRWVMTRNSSRNQQSLSTTLTAKESSLLE
jgi:hypothetical protein